MEGLLALLPTGLMLAVVAHQRWRVRTTHQTLWKGGGFGMFADIPRNSLVTVLLGERVRSKPQERLILAPPEQFAKVSAIPTAANVTAHGTQALNTRWQRCGSSDCGHRIVEESSAFAAESAIVTHLAIDFDGRIGRYESAIVRSIELRHVEPLR